MWRCGGKQVEEDWLTDFGQRAHISVLEAYIYLCFRIRSIHLSSFTMFRRHVRPEVIRMINAYLATHC